MGIISKFIFIGVPITITCTIYSFSLKSKLPIHSRNLGNNIGMFYNYFKVILKILKPDS
jgi:hypothetical protein